MRTDSKLAEWGKGKIRAFLTNRKTGEKIEVIARDNIITYSAADIMAKMLGGDASYVPAYMGFVYGPTGSTLANPELTRVHTWDGIATEIAGMAATGNILISPLATAPGFDIDPAGSSYYENNAVTLTAHTGRRLEYAFSTTGGTYAPEMQDDGTDYMYQAMLITRLVDGNTITYIPFSRVSLDIASVYPAKPDGWELSLFWQVTYF